MNRIEEYLLNTTKHAVSGQKPADPDFTGSQWEALLRLAAEQEILPMVYDAVCSCPSFRKDLDKEKREFYQKQALQSATRYIVQTNEFLTLILHAQAQGLDPLVLKGIAISSLYPQPVLRPSVDADLLIRPEDDVKWHEFLLSEGMFSDDGESDISKIEEPSYHKENSPLYIEIHKHLFAPDSRAYSDLNSLFEGAQERTRKLQAEDVTLRVLSPTDHILYLICHAYKHFLHSGTGVRHIADIAVLANRFKDETDWQHIYKECSALRLEKFTAALLKIAYKHLALENYPEAFSHTDVDEMPLLEDSFAGGLYGTADIDRAHSANITLAAAERKSRGANRDKEKTSAADKNSARRGRKASTSAREASKGILRSLFPGKDYLQNMFPYAKKHPVLLPAAWANRIINYKKSSSGRAADPTRSIRIGQSRVELMKKYDILQ